MRSATKTTFLPLKEDFSSDLFPTVCIRWRCYLKTKEKRCREWRERRNALANKLGFEREHHTRAFLRSSKQLPTALACRRKSSHKRKSQHKEAPKALQMTFRQHQPMSELVEHNLTAFSSNTMTGHSLKITK